MPQYSYTLKRAKHFDKYPDYSVVLESSDKGIQVLFADELTAETRNAVVVKETSLEPVYYLPIEDIKADVFVRSDYTSFCPFKGDASYYSLHGSDRQSGNAVWTYHNPYAEVAGLKDYVAFYKDKVTIQEG